MRALCSRFLAAADGSAATAYMIFTASWFLVMAAGVHYATPRMTTKLEAISSALKPGGGPYR